jgi:tight adherence protein B
MWVLQPGAKFSDEQDPSGDSAVKTSGDAFLIKDEDLSTIAIWSDLLKGISHVETLRRWLEEAGLEWSVGRVTWFMLLSGSAVYALFWRSELLPSGVSFVAAIIAASIPLALIRMLRQRRFRQFSDQFPEALDSLTRALKAGYPLSAAVDLLAMEQPEPLAGEMRRLRDQWKLGVGWDLALDDLSNRIPLPEVSMFVAAVKMQNRVGGRLNDVLARLGESMRDNQVFESEVRSIAAHSRITGSILTVLPIAIAIMLYVVNPDYILTLVRREEGRLMLLAVVVANVAAHFLVRKLTQMRI